MMLSGATPPRNPPGEVTVRVSPTCSMVVGRDDSQSRWTIPLTMASRSVLGGMARILPWANPLAVCVTRLATSACLFDFLHLREQGSNALDTQGAVAPRHVAADVVDARPGGFHEQQRARVGEPVRVLDQVEAAEEVGVGGIGQVDSGFISVGLSQVVAGDLACRGDLRRSGFGQTAGPTSRTRFAPASSTASRRGRHRRSWRRRAISASHRTERDRVPSTQARIRMRHPSRFAARAVIVSLFDVSSQMR